MVLTVFNRYSPLRNWLILPFLILLGLVQATLLDNFRIFGVKPDFLLIAIVIASTFFEWKKIVILAIFAGMLKDSLSINMFGMNTLLFPLWSYVTRVLSGKINLDNNIAYAVLILVIGILSGIIKFIFVFLGSAFFIPPGVFLRITFLESVYSAIATPLIFEIIKPALLKERVHDNLKTITLTEK
jgi:rod shape-determining protein MreD